MLSPLLSRLFLKIRLKIPKINWLYLALPIALIAHLLVGNLTPMTRDLVDINGHYILKIVILTLFILGTRNIKIIK